jgi:predicted O-linked N-acetylglucosamine transferase (SPINDLY family)
VTLAGVPCEPARASLKHLSENPLGLVRQLEHRVQDLDGLKARTIAKQQQAAQEAARAQEALGRPFKHTNDLHHARRQLHEISEQMQKATNHAPAEHDVPPSPPAAAASTDYTSDRDPRETSLGHAAQGRYPPRPRPAALSPLIPEPQAARHLDHRAEKRRGAG